MVNCCESKGNKLRDLRYTLSFINSHTFETKAHLRVMSHTQFDEKQRIRFTYMFYIMKYGQSQIILKKK